MDLFLRVQQVVAAALKVPPNKITVDTCDKDLSAWDSWLM